jgi:BRCT domain type II-containing protein
MEEKDLTDKIMERTAQRSNAKPSKFTLAACFDASDSPVRNEDFYQPARPARNSSPSMAMSQRTFVAGRIIFTLPNRENETWRKYNARDKRNAYND